MVMGVRQLMILGTMNMVIKNGGSVADALSSASKVVAGTRIGEEIKLVAVKFASGLRLEESFRRYSGCDKQVSHMIGAGEKAGTLAEQLGLLTEMYEEQTSDAMDIFVGASSFLTLLIATAMIGFVFLSSVLPTVLMGPKMLEVMH
jgi:type II secretory pathway component PulF